MRLALTTALMTMMAAIALADEPSTPESKTETAAETKAEARATQAAATETTAKIATEEEKPFKPPAGYKPKRINGDQVWCAKVHVLGTKFPKEDCRTEAQLRDMERTNRAMREDLNRGRACVGAGCASN
jgi:hypothetical protein